MIYLALRGDWPQFISPVIVVIDHPDGSRENRRIVALRIQSVKS